MTYNVFLTIFVTHLTPKIRFLWLYGQGFNGLKLHIGLRMQISLSRDNRGMTHQFFD